MEAAKCGKRNKDKAAIVIVLPTYLSTYLPTSAYLVAMAVVVVIPTYLPTYLCLLGSNGSGSGNTNLPAYLPTCLPAYLPACLPACLRSSISNKASSNRPLPF